MTDRAAVQLHTDYGSLGDQIAFLGAARHYARAHPETKVVVTNLPEIVGAYGDSVLGTGEAADRIPCNPEGRHRVRRESPDFNYLGTYIAELGLPLGEPPAIELPKLSPPPGLLPQAYISLQPYSGFAPSLHRNTLQFFVDVCRQVCPEWPVVATGSLRTPRDLRDVDYRYLGTPASVLRTIQHAAVVVTPRSASAHIAAAYRVPAFVWIPDDGENWHLDYPDWPHGRVPLEDSPNTVADRLAHMLHLVRTGAYARTNGIRKALERSEVSTPTRFFRGLGTAAPQSLIDTTSCASPAETVRRIIHASTGSDPGPYPPYLSRGNAAEYVVDEASAICQGSGIDVGAAEWPFPGAVPVRDEPRQNAYSLPQFPDGSLDYVFSSHVLEHLFRPQEALALWASKLKPGGVLFLYLPHPRMVLWHPEGSWGGDHKWITSPRHVARLVSDLGMSVRILTEVPDAYWSFRCVAIRPGA